MKVYVLNMEYTYGTIKGIECVGVYDTKEKAQKAMEDRIDRTKKIGKNIGMPILPNTSILSKVMEWA